MPKSQAEIYKAQVQDFFFQSGPGGKGPKWENIGLVTFLTGAFGYYFMTKQTSSEEVTYIDFVNNYLSKGQCKMITISEDKNNSEIFKFKAEVETHSGQKVHLTLPQVENFLYKLDQA